MSLVDEIHIMANTLKHGYFEEEKKQHSALKVFVVLKGIFKHLSQSELQNARLVDRKWNFVAVSECIHRKYSLSAIKLCISSSNDSCDGGYDYSWYLEFENNRRTLWRDLYGDDCPILEFHHLNFIYPEITQDFVNILESSWISSVTTLTLSTKSGTRGKLLKDWVLPYMPNLQNLSCSVKVASDIESTENDFANLDVTDGSSPACYHQTGAIRKRLNGKRSFKVLSFSVCIEEGCDRDFPWALLGSFHELKDLKLEFGDTTSLIKCAEDLISTSTPRLIETLTIILTHKSNLQQQAKETRRNEKAFAIANAKLCNLFPARTSLNVVSTLPAEGFVEFLDKLIATRSKQIKFEIAVPFDKDRGNVRLRRFLTFVIPEILLKFLRLSDLHLEFLQLSPDPSIHFPRRDQVAQDVPPGKLEQLRLSTILAEIEPAGLLETYYYTNCQYLTLDYTWSWFDHIVELFFEVRNCEDCVVVVDAVCIKFKCIKKLILRGSSNFLQPNISLLYFFPDLDRSEFPGEWFHRAGVSLHYEGLPGIQSLEVFGLEQCGTLYTPSVASEVSKMPRLELIHLDPLFNAVIQSNSLAPHIKDKRYEEEMVWPSCVGQVSILSKMPDSSG